MVELLLKRGADVNARDGAGGTALYLAAQKGFLSVAEVLIKHKAELNAQNGSSKGEKTSLHVAVQHGNVAVVDLLLANGADANVRDSGGYTPLHFAATLGQDAVVGQLLKAGADVDAFANSKQTPLFLACAGNQPAAVKLLLASKADPNLVDNKGHTPLSYSVSPRLSSGGFGVSGLNPGRRELVKTLLEAKADPNKGLADSPLLLAVRADDVKLAEMLLRAGADPNQPTECEGVTQTRNPDGSFSRRYERRNRTVKRTPLQAAVLEDHPAMVKLLLQSKADPKANNPDGEPLIQDTLSNPEMLKAFLKAGADPNATDKNGQTLLRRTMIGYRNSETVELLRQHGGLEDVPDFSTIRVKRGNLVSPTVVFRKDTNSLNRFTLFEVLRHCDYVGLPRAGFSFARPPSLPFPDFSRVRISRPVSDKSAEHKEIPALILTATNTFDCAKDVWLEFGDVIDIPEREHSLADINSGLTNAQSVSLDQCLKRTVTFVIKGQSLEIKLGGHAASFWLSQALRLPEVQSTLRSSSNLARVKVKRADPQTKQPREVVMDVEAFWKNEKPIWEDLWLRDGDVIEVPDKP